MSVEPSIPELATGEAKDLIENYRKGQLGPTDEITLFELLNECQKKYQKKFKLAEVLKASFDYTVFEIKHLDSEYHRWLKRQIKEDAPNQEPIGPAAPPLMEKAKQIGQGATKALLGEVQELGNVLVLQYAQKAALRGKGLKDYIIECIDFREQYGDNMEELAQENQILKVLCSMFTEAVKPQFKQMAASRMYLDFVTNLMQLQALGIELNLKWVDETASKIETAMGIKIS